EDFLGDVPPRLLLIPGSRHPQRPTRAQTGDEFPLQRTSTFDVKRLIDRLVADAHGFIIWEVDGESPRDLLRAPCLRPPAVLAVRLVAPLPLRTVRPGDLAVRSMHNPGEPFLHVLAQPLVRDHLRDLR